MTDKMREKFESWMTDGGKWPMAVECDAAGHYKLMIASLQWIAWQAAYPAGVAAERERAAKVCESLEQEYWQDYKHRTGTQYAEGQSDAAAECAAAIRKGEP